MSAIITDAFRVESAVSLFNYIADANNRVYMYLGKDSLWPNSGDLPVNPINTIKDVSFIHYDLIMAKRLLAGNITLCTNRYNWEFGTVYAQYDTSDAGLNIENKRYYVITKDFNVYKCLNNNFAASSTKEPIGVSIEPFTLDDGYTWKYMFTVSKPVAEVFMNSQFMPVKQDANTNEGQWLVQATAVPGAIESYIVRNKGSGYTTATATVIGDGSGAIAIPLISSGQIVGVFVGNKGNDYTWATVEIVGNGTGATVDAQIAPPGGHGSNPAYELGANYVMAEMQFGQESYATIPDIFSFRKLGLLASPKDQNDANYTDFVASGCHKIYTVITGFVYGDTIVLDDNTTARIVDLGTDMTGTFMLLSETHGVETGQSFYKQGDSGITGLITDVILPDIARNSWTPMYIEHRTQITKNENQLEYVRVVIEF